MVGGAGRARHARRFGVWRAPATLSRGWGLAWRGTGFLRGRGEVSGKSFVRVSERDLRLPLIQRPHGNPSILGWQPAAARPERLLTPRHPKPHPRCASPLPTIERTIRIRSGSLDTHDRRSCCQPAQRGRVARLSGGHPAGWPVGPRPSAPPIETRTGLGSRTPARRANPLGRRPRSDIAISHVFVGKPVTRGVKASTRWEGGFRAFALL